MADRSTRARTAVETARRDEGGPLAADVVAGGPLARPEQHDVARAEPATSADAGLARMGVHPLAAFGMFTIDVMLFTPAEGASGGVGLAVTIPVALALAIPCILLQRYAYGDRWGAALAKGLMIGVLTAIPFPIGAPASAVLGFLGWRARRSGKGK